MPALSANRMRYETASRLATCRVYARDRRVRTVFAALDPHAAPCRVAPRLRSGGDLCDRRRDRGRTDRLLRDPRVSAGDESEAVRREEDQDGEHDEHEERERGGAGLRLRAFVEQRLDLLER